MKSNKKNPALELISTLVRKDSNKSDDVSHMSQMLMFRFLSEVEKLAEERKISRKELANKIEVSPSYLTQVFRGNKPLNFSTLAKIEFCLNFRFDVKAVDCDFIEIDGFSAANISWNDKQINKLVQKFNDGNGLWMYRSKSTSVNYTPKAQERSTVTFGSEPKKLMA